MSPRLTLPTMVALLLALAAPPVQADEDTTFGRQAFTTLFEAACESQDHNSYGQWLGAQKIGRDAIRATMVKDLEAIKQLPRSTQRQEEFNTFIRYYSSSKGGWQTGALRLYDVIQLSDNEISKGRDDSTVVADRLLAGVSRYVNRLVLPLADQILREVESDFHGKQLLFLGRDFTPIYLRAYASGAVDRDRLHLANFSRNVRDEINNRRKLKEARQLLDQVGLGENSLKAGVAIFDSSMAGKIPAAILRAVMEPLLPKDTYRLLRKVEIRYMKSSRRHGNQVSEAAKAAAGGRRELTTQSAEGILRHIDNIPTFELDVPSSYKRYDAHRRHKLLEWVPKYVTTARRFGNDKHGVRLTIDAPATPGARVSSLLGLAVDLEMVGTLPAHEGQGPQHTRAKATAAEAGTAAAAPALDHKLQHEIDQAAANGRVALRRWQDQVTPDAGKQFAKLQLVETGDSKIPYELRVDGKRRFRLKKLLGKGRNITAYLTTHDTVVKVPHAADRLREQLLQVWAGPVMQSYGLDIAKILDFHPRGLWIEQEYVSGETVEQRYASKGQLPRKDQKQILDHWTKAQKLAREKDIWLDLKAANYLTRKDGKLVNVDFTPRLNATYWRYFRHRSQQPLDSQAFLRKFLLHEHNKRVRRRHRRSGI